MSASGVDADGGIGVGDVALAPSTDSYPWSSAVVITPFAFLLNAGRTDGPASRLRPIDIDAESTAKSANLGSYWQRIPTPGPIPITESD
jgi:hypothetical protein